MGRSAPAPAPRHEAPTRTFSPQPAPRVDSSPRFQPSAPRNDPGPRFEAPRRVDTPRSPSPTRTYDPPNARDNMWRGPSSPAPRSDTPRYDSPRPSEPPRRTEQPRFDPIARPSDMPRYDSPTRTGTRTGQSPVRVDDGAGGRHYGDGDASSSSGPVRIVIPGDRAGDAGATPPVRTRINTGLRSSDRDAGGNQSTRGSLRDLYDRAARNGGKAGGDVRRDGPGAGSEMGSSGMRSSLSSRYRVKMDSDLARAGRTAPAPDAKADGGVRADRSPGQRSGTDVRGGDKTRGGTGDELGRKGRDGDAGAGSDRKNPGERSKPRTDGRSDLDRAGRDDSGKSARRDAPRKNDAAGHRYAPGDTVRGDRVAIDRRPDAGPPGLGTPRTPNPTVQRAPPLTPGSGLEPRLRGPRLVNHALRSGNPASYYCGTTHWGGHYSSLCFGFGWSSGYCSWGLYSYPYSYGCYYPRWYWGCRSWFSLGFCGWYPYGYYSSCGWPGWYSSSWCYPYWSSGYSPGWSSYDWWWDPSWPAYGSSYVVVREVDDDEGDVVVAGDPPPKASPKSLAEKHVRLGDFYFSEARYKEASENYLRALTYAPEDASIHFVLADALFAMGDYHYAAFVIGRALTYDPAFAKVEADKRKYYSDKSLFDAQLATLRNYLKDKPYDAASHLVLGYNLKFSADPDGAKAAFRRVIEIDPHQEAAKLFLAALEPAKAEAAPESVPATKPESRPDGK